jgi:molybdenum cofactor biosynthesis enzyme MoaA
MLFAKEKPPNSMLSSQAFCAYPFTRFKITCEGNATMCCYQERKCLGNILEQGFEQVWFGPIAQAIRQETLQNQLHPLCKIDACPFYHRPQLQPTTIHHRVFPTQFEIDLPSQHCNIGGENPSPDNPACIMCERHTNYIKQEDRLDAVCEMLKPYVQYVDAIHIQGVAEPFWKERIFDILGLLEVDRFKDRLTISTTTNGTLMNAERRKRFLAYPRSNITFSLDAAKPETYRVIRRVDMFDRILDNLFSYAVERRRGLQGLSIHNNINLLNVNEVVGMVEIAARARVDVLDFNPTCETPVIMVDRSNVKIFRDAQKSIIEAARKFGVKTTFMRNLTLDLDDTPWPTGTLANTGEVLPLVQLSLPM